MNKTLNALFKKLTWQLDKLSNARQSMKHQIVQLDQQIDLNQQTIAKAHVIPTSIMPEKEIARGHFMIQLQQNQKELLHKQAALQAELYTLTQQQTQLNTELKRLEKHQDALLKKQQQAFWLNEQNHSDEWVLQRKVSHEN